MPGRYHKRDAYLETIRVGNRSYTCPACGRHYGKYALAEHLYDVHRLNLTPDGELIQAQYSGTDARSTIRTDATATAEVAGYGLSGKPVNVDTILQERLADGRARVLTRTRIALK